MPLPTDQARQHRRLAWRIHFEWGGWEGAANLALSGFGPERQPNVSAVRLLHRRHRGIVEFFRPNAGRTVADALPIFLEGRALFDGAEHHAEADMGADVDIGGREF